MDRKHIGIMRRVERLLYAVAPLVPTRLLVPLSKIYRRYIRPRNAAAENYLKSLAIPVDHEVVLYESFYGSSMSCSPRAIFDALLDQPGSEGIRHVWAVKSTLSMPEVLRVHPRVSYVVSGSVEYAQMLATAGIIVSNSTLPTYFSRRPGQKYANTWHGVPLKRMFKFESLDHPTVHRNSQRNFLQASHLLLPNSFANDSLLGAADVAEACEGRVFLTGAPRVDQTLNTDVKALRKELGAEDGRKIIFFAPTWRGKLGDAEAQDRDLEEFLTKLASFDDAQYAVFVQLHNFVGHQLSSFRTVPSGMSTNRFMAAVDVLVTDYSSIMFDFFATGRPVVLFAYDREDYAASRGFNFALEELPATICLTADETIAAIKAARRADDHPLFASAKSRFFSHEDGAATQRAIEAILRPVPDRLKKRPRLLIWGGGLKNNGITSSLISLLNELALRDVDVYLVTEGSALERSREFLDNLAKVPEGIKLIHRAGGLETSKEEHDALHAYYGKNSFQTDQHRAVVMAIFEREARRLFGDMTFDVAIDFSAYARYWNLLMAAVPAERKVVYQHNDLLSEALKRYDVLHGTFVNYSQFDAIVSVSEETRRLNEDSLGHHYRTADQSRAVRNMINSQDIMAKAGMPAEVEIQLPRGRPTFVTVGRLSPEKAQLRAILAVAELREAGIDVNLVILGDGPLMAELASKVSELRLGDRVQLAGFVSNPFPIIKAADCFVLSSDYEGQPMVLLEALTVGVPIISTDIAGSRSVLGGNLGYLVPASVEGVAAGMMAYIKGEVAASAFDAESYRAAAFNDFEEHVTAFPLPKRMVA